MILLWGLSTDGPLAAVRAALLERNAAVAFLDQQEVLQCEIDIAFDGHLRGHLATPDFSTGLESIAAVYLRPYDTRRISVVKSLEPADPDLRRALAFDDAIYSWADMTPALVINRPSAMTSNHSKPYQLELIRAAGFDVPETLITTDPCAVEEFWARHGSVIYKSISGIRSIVTRLDHEHRARLAQVAHCPTQFQQYVDGSDFRVHVVGGEIFACEISSSADDYRYPSRGALSAGSPGICEAIIEPDLADGCRHLAASLNLVVAGIDLRRTRAGQWFCFEVNPSPAFTFYEEATGQPIARAIARLLARGGAQSFSSRATS